MRKPLDFYPTPMSVVESMAERFLELRMRISSFPPYSIWEPCAGDGRIVEEMKERGVQKVIASDIKNGEDFFDFTEAPSPIVITNPPFRQIRPFILHAFQIGVKEMALVCNERLWACKKGRKQFELYKPSVFAMMDWREDYLGKGGKPDRSLAVSIWMQPCASRCSYEVWQKM
jgi:hypothetical protein